MIDRFQRFISDNHLLEASDKVLLAISGGVDSVVMAYLFHGCGYKFALAHCNFQLRGIEADKDEQLVESMAKKWGCRFFSKNFRTNEYSREKGISTQVAARELRYNWLRELIENEGFDKIATAHHQSDLVETVLINLTRGTGLTGLRGIPLTRDRIIRPMLFASKAEIIGYAKENELVWREDQSNLESKYTRNLMRNDIIPQLEQINPGVIENISRTANYLNQIQVLVDQQMKSIESKAVTKEGPDIIIGLGDISHKLRTPFLSHYLLKFGFNHTQITDVLSTLDSVGALFQSSGYQLNIDRNRILISPLDEEAECYEVDYSDGLLKTIFLDLSFEKLESTDHPISQEPSVGCLDLDKIEYPLRVRTWKPGDQFVPLGMQGKKKLSDFMIDEKIPLNLKRRQLVVTSGDNIVWIVGRRIADPFKITRATKRMLQIKLHLHA